MKTLQEHTLRHEYTNKVVAERCFDIKGEYRHLRGGEYGEAKSLHFPYYGGKAGKDARMSAG